MSGANPATGAYVETCLLVILELEVEQPIMIDKASPDWHEVDRLRDIAKKYDELIYQVGIVWPNETRHETALRYLRRAEEVTDKAAQAAVGTTKVD